MRRVNADTACVMELPDLKAALEQQGATGRRNAGGILAFYPDGDSEVAQGDYRSEGAASELMPDENVKGEM